jgi:long-chain acyl-CoA synthetase
MEGAIIIDLNKVIPSLQQARSGYLEFYEGTGLTKKSLQEIYADVCAAAAELARRGLVPGARVGIYGVTSYAWVIVDLACLARGLITVPLDPEASWDRERLAEMYALDLVVTDHLDGTGPSRPFVSFESLCGAPRAGTEMEQARFDDDAAFTVIFTSGTSGEPKAIEVRKRCFDDQFSHALRLFRLTAGDKMLVFLPMHIYLERCYVYLAILHGFSIVVVSPRFVLKALKQSGFTFTVGVPNFFYSLQDLFLLSVKHSAWLRLRLRARLTLHRLGFTLKTPFGPFNRLLGGRARLLLTGSAPCRLPTLQFYQAMGIPLYEGYGMSEIAGMLALNYPGHTKLGTVGKVFPNVEVKLDARNQILVRGANVANTGYWRASATDNAATFLPDGWVATGDVGHFDDEGYLTIDGRIKDVVVLSNGHKVQPASIEAEIERIQSVDRSVVLGDERPYLIALVSLKIPGVGKEAIDDGISRINQARSEGERIKRHRILDEHFTVENGLLNRAFKLDRARIKHMYAALIDELYAS